MPANSNLSATMSETAGEVFDRRHLIDYSMQNQDLAVEILGLYLLQLPAMLQALEEAASGTEWAFATHTLKGSSASIGARRLWTLASELETMGFLEDANVRLLRVQAVKAAAFEFRREADRAYPAQGPESGSTF